MQTRMTSEKTFDKADLLRFFYEAEEEAVIGKFTVIHPPTPTQLAFDQDADQGEVQKCPVAAETTALYCDRYGFAVVLQTVGFPGGGSHFLPKGHALRSMAKEGRVITRHGGTSAQLVRWATGLAEEWRNTVGYCVPLAPIDLRRKPGRTDDNMPTGETVDDVFAQHGGAGADVTPPTCFACWLRAKASGRLRTATPTQLRLSLRCCFSSCSAATQRATCLRGCPSSST